MSWSRSLKAALVGVGFGVGLFAGSPGASAAGKQPDHITVAYQPLVAIPEGAMKQEKWLEKAAGLPVQWKDFSSGADVNTAFAAGAVDFGLVGLPVFVSGIAQGIPYRLILLYDIPGTEDGLVAREGISSIKDLKGKRIGVPFGSGADYMLQGVLKVNGMSANDVTLVNLQPQPIVAAWATGQIDAAQIWAPTLGKLLDTKGKLLTNDGEMAKKGYFAGDVAVVSDRFAEKYPDLVKKFVEQNLRAVNWVNAEKPQAYKVMMKEYQLSPAEFKIAALPPATVFPSQKEQLSDHWLGGKGLIDSSMQIGQFLLKNKLIAKAPTRQQMQKAIDPTFLKEAQVPPSL